LSIDLNHPTGFFGDGSNRTGLQAQGGVAVHAHTGNETHENLEPSPVCPGTHGNALGAILIPPGPQGSGDLPQSLLSYEG